MLDPNDQPTAGAGFALFETAIGTCGVAWHDDALMGVQLPERDTAATRGRLRRRFPNARETKPSADMASVIERIVGLLSGERIDLTSVAVDMDGLPEFDRDVYVAARAIPPGSTLTYGEIAKRIGRPGSARDVGAALGRNPFAIVVPCHRVVAANGKAGGFSGGRGVETKLRLLAIEGGAGPLFELDVSGGGA
jgi:methylated-DNA-[protein]-cysteine S-methyltransferase